MSNPYEPSPTPEPADEAAPTAATPQASSGRGDMFLGAVVIVAIVVGAVWLVSSLIRGDIDDHDAAVALNQHINGMGQDFASYSNYKGTQPDGGTGAVAIRTSLFDKPENEQFAEYMCSSLAFTRSSIPTVKHVRVLSSSDTTLAHCF